MIFKIEPYLGIIIENKRLIRLGMSRNEVRTLLFEKSKEFFKSSDSKISTQAFDRIGLHAYFKDSNELEAIEIFPNSRQREQTLKPKVDEIDYYLQSSLQLEFGETDILKSVEFSNEVDVLFKNKHLFQMTYRELENWFRKLDPDLEIEEIEGFTSYKLGIAAWFPKDEEDKRTKIAESILIFERGYYD